MAPVGPRANERRAAVAPWGVRLKLAALALALVLAGAGRASPAADEIPGHLVRLPDGRHINLRCSAGAGSGPVVLLESGWGASSQAWSRVQKGVRAARRVCAYDRAGYGLSDEGPSPRDGAAIVRDLEATLTAGHISGPFVLVGHSAGALYVRLFADHHPHAVIGMVLVEPSVEYQDRRFAGPGAAAPRPSPLRLRAEACLAAQAKGDLPSPDPALARCAKGSPKVWRTEIAELDSLWAATSDEVAAGRASLGALPLVVLTADGTYAAAPTTVRDAAQAAWTRMHRELAARSSRGVERLVEHSSHMMPHDRPDAIIAAIDEVTADAERR